MKGNGIFASEVRGDITLNQNYNEICYFSVSISILKYPTFIGLYIFQNTEVLLIDSGPNHPFCQYGKKVENSGLVLLKPQKPINK